MWWTLSVTNKNFLRSTLVLIVNSVAYRRPVGDYCCYRLFHLKDNRETSCDKCIKTAELRFRNARTSCLAVASFCSRFNQNLYHSNLICTVVADSGILIQKVNVTSWQKVSQGNIIGAISVCVCVCVFAGGGGAGVPGCSPKPSPKAKVYKTQILYTRWYQKDLLPKSADD